MIFIMVCPVFMYFFVFVILYTAQQMKFSIKNFFS